MVVDGKLITAENYDSATYFGEVIAREIYAEIAKDNGPFVVSGNQLLVQGTMQNDVIYVWSGRGNTVFAWVNGQASGAVALPVGGRVIVYGGEGNDRIFATDLSIPTSIYGGSGHDLITVEVTTTFSKVAMAWIAFPVAMETTSFEAEQGMISSTVKEATTYCWERPAMII